MKTVLVTGGCGYIGSHTIIDLIANGFQVVSIDNHSRSDAGMTERIKEVCGTEVKNYSIDICDKDALRDVFLNHQFVGVIHFAAYKSVNESVEQPWMYYSNNLVSLLNILDCIEEFKVGNFIFSSSCSVYGNVLQMPVTEETVLCKAESPYGRTKQMGEDIIIDIAKASNTNYVLLRYFNPAGAHPSALIGEVPHGAPTTLVPVITRFAAGKSSRLSVFGTDYSTRDGSCVRDFVHVCDIADAHTKALEWLLEGKNVSNHEIFNLGTGTGVTVLEAITAFEKIAQKKLAVTYADRREGDVVAIYANNEKAYRMLGWKPRYNLEDIMATAWKWQQNL